MKSPNKKTNNPPLKIIKRLMGVILKNYTPHCIIVLMCIFGAAFVNVKGTLFMQQLIDNYIVPMMSQSSPDFGPLVKALMKLAMFYVAGILMTYAYNRIMVNVSQGTMKKIRIDLFTHMESLPIKYFDTHAHGDIMSIYTNDTDTLRQMIGQSMPQLVNSAVTIVSVFVSMIILNIPLTILTVIMVGFMMFTTGKVASKAGTYFGKQQKSIGELMENSRINLGFGHGSFIQNRLFEARDRIGDGFYQSVDFRFLFRCKGRLQRQRFVQDCHVLAAFDDLAHQLAAGRCPGTILNEGNGSVLDIMGCQIMQQFLHGNENPCIICCRCK